MLLITYLHEHKNSSNLITLKNKGKQKTLVFFQSPLGEI